MLYFNSQTNWIFLAAIFVWIGKKKRNFIQLQQESLMIMEVLSEQWSMLLKEWGFSKHCEVIIYQKNQDV